MRLPEEVSKKREVTSSPVAEYGMRPHRVKLNVRWRTLVCPLSEIAIEVFEPNRAEQRNAH